MEGVTLYLSSGKYPSGATENEKRRIRKQCKCFHYENGKRFRLRKSKSGESTKTLCIEDNEEKVKILEECHDRNGHKGVMLRSVESRYYWPSWTSFVKDYCLSCEQCQQVNASIKPKLAEDLHPIPVKADLWSQWGIDFVGPLAETSSKYMYTREKYAPEDLQNWQSTHPEMDRQTDGHGCGVFILMFAEAILAGVPLQLMTQLHVTMFRRYIKARILVYAVDNKDDVCSMPFCHQPSNDVWRQCDDCNLWAHSRCAGIMKKRNGKCHLCKWRMEANN